MLLSARGVGTYCGSAVSRTSFFDLCSGDADVGLETSDENGRKRTENLLIVSRPIFFHRKRERDGKRDKREYENEQIWTKILRKRAGTGPFIRMHVYLCITHVYKHTSTLK
jgi:hypothetical protein